MNRKKAFELKFKNSMRILDSVALIRESLKISMNIFYKVKKVHVLGRLQADSSLELKSRLPESLTPAKSETYIGRSPTSNMEIFVKIVNSRSEYVPE